MAQRQIGLSRKTIMKPLISVIIPAYNAERYFVETLKSVLEQTYHTLEVIVVDDGSTDKTKAIIDTFHEYLSRVISQKNEGIGSARNHGVGVCRGKFISFLDADDLWVPEKLSLQLEAFSKHPDSDMVFGHVEQFISPEIDPKERVKIQCPVKPMPGVVAGTLLIRRDAFWKVGLFDPSLKVGEFIDWYARAKDANLKELLLPETLLKRRIHSTNTGLEQSQDQYLKVLRNTLERRRQEREPKKKND